MTKNQRAISNPLGILAGVPMMNGSSVLLEGYIPEVDATIVTRILGVEIVGKAVCEHLCFSAHSFTSDTELVRNPYDFSRTAGGSYSSSASLVASREVDMAIGGDQGGSISIPSSWCGVYGLKPSYGLEPRRECFLLNKLCVWKGVPLSPCNEPDMAAHSLNRIVAFCTLGA